jgi:hypothetical protein
MRRMMKSVERRKHRSVKQTMAQIKQNIVHAKLDYRCYHSSIPTCDAPLRLAVKQEKRHNNATNLRKLVQSTHKCHVYKQRLAVRVMPWQEALQKDNNPKRKLIKHKPSQQSSPMRGHARLNGLIHYQAQRPQQHKASHTLHRLVKKKKKKKKKKHQQKKKH